MIGATISERLEPDNRPAPRARRGASFARVRLSKELLQPFFQERLRETAKDAVLQVRARRAVRAPDTEVDTHHAVTAVREGVAHLLRRSADGRLGDQEGQLVGKLTGREADLTLSQDLDVARDETHDRCPEHVAGEDEVDGAFLEPLIPEERQVQGRRDSAQHRQVVELAISDLGMTLSGGALGGPREARLRLEAAAQLAASKGGQERLRPGVAELERDRVPRRAGEADRRPAFESTVRQLAAEWSEGEVAALEFERSREGPDVHPLGDP